MTPQPLILLGLGPHVREMAEIVERINAVSPTWELLGYITEDSSLTGQDWNGYPVLGGPEAVKRYPGALFSPESEWHRLDAVPRERYATLIDPTTFVSRSAKIGRGCVVYPNGFIGFRAHLGDFVFCLGGCTINHDNVLGERVMLASRVTLAGGVTIAERAYLGQGCNVRQNLRIGTRCLVGMGSVVVKDVAPHTVVVGNPARPISQSNDTNRPGSGMGSGEFRRFQQEEGG
jgi:sugar O-acyltransferase (sialic acid O-acetyltransferase NeuD family)